MINKAIFEEKWDLIRGQINSRWSLMAETDLNKVDKADVKFDKFVTMLQVKYGYTRQIAREEVGKLWAEYETANKDNESAVSQVIDNIRSKTNGRITRKNKTQASIPGKAQAYTANETGSA